MMGFCLTALAQETETREVPYPVSGKDDGNKRATIIAFGPSVWAPSMKFEQGIGDLVSIGLVAKGRLILFEGARVDPFVRFYPGRRSPEGGYIQLKGSFGVFKNNFIYDDWTGNGNNCYYDSQGNLICDNDHYYAYGGGVTGGYQLISGKNDHFVFDVYGGFQYIHTDELGTIDNIFRRWIVRFPIDVGLKLGVAF
jgi:hypothetical protein